MAIRLAPEPADARAAILRAVLATGPTTDATASLTAQRLVGASYDLSVALPLPVHVMDIDALASDLLPERTHVGWQYLLLSSSVPVATAELVVDRDGRSRVTAVVTGGTHCEELQRALERLELEPDLDGELALVRIPALAMTAVSVSHRAGPLRLFSLPDGQSLDVASLRVEARDALTPEPEECP